MNHLQINSVASNAVLQFEDIVERALTFEKGSDRELTVNYLKDVSLLLSLVSAVRECNIEQHLHAERNMNYLTFAYDHQNYAHYNTSKFLPIPSQTNRYHPAFHDLKTKGIGGSITGEIFSAVHLQNCSTKRLKVLLFRFVLDSVQTLMQ